jgi:Rhodopirellula transposase DDE domain
MGDPERALKWVSKRPAKLADALRAHGHEVSPNTVSKLLEERLGYSRQVNRKTLATLSSSTQRQGYTL